jgi:hypothetical protein
MWLGICKVDPVPPGGGFGAEIKKFQHGSEQLIFHKQHGLLSYFCSGGKNL